MLDLTAGQLRVLRAMPRPQAVIGITYKLLAGKVGIPLDRLRELTLQLEEKGLITRGYKEKSHCLWMQLTLEGDGELNARDRLQYNVETREITRVSQGSH